MKKSLTSGIILLLLFNSSATIGFADNKMKLISLVPAITIEEPIVEENVLEEENAGNIEIISPSGEVIVSDSILISMKINNVKSAVLKIYKVVEEADEETTETVIFGPEEIKTEDDFEFYTTQIDDVLPGNYKIVVNILDENNSTIENITKNVIVKNKEEIKTDMDNTKQTIKQTESNSFSIQNVLKNILK